jgi:hypothetical protein
MPIGIANIFSGGSNSRGVKYLLSYFAAVLSGAVMFVAMKLGFAFMTTILNSDYGVTSSTLIILAIQFSIVGACMSASAKAKEIIGV